MENLGSLLAMVISDLLIIGIIIFVVILGGLGGYFVLKGKNRYN